MKDVTLPEDSTKASVLLCKHADYIEAFEKNKDDYVREQVGVVLNDLKATVCCDPLPNGDVGIV